MNRILIVAALSLPLALCACSGQSVQQAQDGINQSRELLVTETQRYQLAYEDALARGDEKAAERAKKSLDTLAKLDENLARGEAALGQVITPDGGIDADGLGRLASDFLPYPFNIVAVLGAGAVTWVLRQKKINEAVGAAKSIVNGIDAARMNDPAFAAALKNNATAIGGQLTPTAAKIVASESIVKPPEPVAPIG